MTEYQPMTSRGAFYKEYYRQQAGNGLSVYRGRRYVAPSGNGFGSVFRSIARRAAPFLKRGAMTAGKALLQTGTEVLGDALDGKNIGESAKRRFASSGKQLGKTLLSDARDELLGSRKRSIGSSETTVARASKVKSRKKHRSTRTGAGLGVFD